MVQFNLDILKNVSQEILREIKDLLSVSIFNNEKEDDNLLIQGITELGLDDFDKKENKFKFRGVQVYGKE